MTTGKRTTSADGGGSQRDPGTATRRPRQAAPSNGDGAAGTSGGRDTGSGTGGNTVPGGGHTSVPGAGDNSTPAAGDGSTRGTPGGSATGGNPGSDASILELPPAGGSGDHGTSGPNPGAGAAGAALSGTATVAPPTGAAGAPRATVMPPVRAVSRGRTLPAPVQTRSLHAFGSRAPAPQPIFARPLQGVRVAQAASPVHRRHSHRSAPAVRRATPAAAPAWSAPLPATTEQEALREVRSHAGRVASEAPAPPRTSGGGTRRPLPKTPFGPPGRGVVGGAGGAPGATAAGGVVCAILTAFVLLLIAPPLGRCRLAPVLAVPAGFAPVQQRPG